MESVNVTVNLYVVFWSLLVAILLIGIVLFFYLILFLRRLLKTVSEATVAIKKVQDLVDDTSKVMQQTYEITARANSSYRKMNTLVDGLTTAVTGFVANKLQRKKK